MGTIYRNGTAFIGSGGAGGVELTQAEYDALPTTEKMNGSIYFISDGEASYPSASTMRYDNSTSGLTATSVQDAVDEVNEKVNDNAGDIATLNNGLNIKTVTDTDGTAVKFPDGTLFVYGTKNVSLGTSATTVHVTFPVRFNGAPSVTESTGAGGTRTEAYIEDVNDVGFNAYFSSRSVTSTSWLRYIAIGRWK